MATMRSLRTEQHGDRTLEQLEVVENDGSTRTGWDVTHDPCGDAIITAATEAEARDALTAEHVCTPIDDDAGGPPLGMR